VIADHMFTGGESAGGQPHQLLTTPTPLFTEKSNGAFVGKQVVGNIGSSLEEVLTGCVRTHQFIDGIGDDAAQLDAFTSALADGKVLSKLEARLGLSSPKLSKLRAIGKNVEFFRRPELFDYLVELHCSGISQIYQLLPLYAQYKGTDEERFKDFLRDVKAEPPTSRTLSKLTRDLKQASRESEGGELGPAETHARLYDLICADLWYSHDTAMLLEDWADRPPSILRVCERVAEDATAIVFTRLSDIPLVENKLLPGLGFDNISAVHLVHPPATSNITTAIVLVVAERGSPASAADFQWSPPGQTVDLLTIAKLMFPEAKEKLHVLASSNAEDWDCMVGHENWSIGDE
jgi:hypothetical protein